jgi:hypothetical protein
MSTLHLAGMRQYLSLSMSSLNQNKLRGTLAEIDFRRYLSQIGFADRVSPGGWIARRKGANVFGHSTVALFPEIITPATQYSVNRNLPNPLHGLHTICSTFHQSGIAGFYCAATIASEGDPSSMEWSAIQLGLPSQQQYQPLVHALDPLQFVPRSRAYNYLRYHTDTTSIPDIAVPEEFSKEHLRVSFGTPYLAEISDIDGIFWGQQFTYPIEIKEKTPAPSTDMGPYFGLDVGPFVKLAFYAAKRGNLHSLYVVREINNEEERELVQWLFITFDQLAQYASWVARAGGTNMQGGGSSVVRIPRCEFRPLTAATIATL